MANENTTPANPAQINGPVRVVMPDQNGSFKLNVPQASVQKVQVVDVDLVLHMADGTKVVLAGGAMEAMDDKSKVSFADTSASTGRLLDTVGQIPLAPNDQSKVLNSDPIAATDHVNNADAIGTGQGHAGGDRNSAPVSSDAVSQLAKIISDNSGSVTNGTQNLSIPTQPTAGDASSASVQSAIAASQSSNDSITKPSDVQLPPERPATTPSTVVTGPNQPTLSVNLVNLTTQTKVGSVLYGSGGTPQSATDGSNAVQFASQVINATSDVTTIYADGNNSNTFIKVFNVTVAGDVTVKTLTITGVPADITILNATFQGNGTYTVDVSSGSTSSNSTSYNLQFQYATRTADASNPVHEQFDLTVTTTLGTDNGVLTLTDTRHVAIKDATSSADLTYLDPSTGDNVLILPAQGVPHEVHAGNNAGTTIYGSNANDSLYGGTGNDTLYGGTGSSSFFHGGAGADQLVGSATGNNTASYSGSPTGVTVDLTTGLGSGGDAAGDVLTNIQNLIGSDYADTFVASSQANKFDGGGGVNTVSYTHSTSGVTVNLVTGIGSGGDAAGDTYTNIQNVIGSTSNDTFVASLAANSFTGNGGSDTVSYASSTSGVIVNLKTNLGSGGYAAGDTYNGISNFIGSAFDDTFVGDGAVNNFDGGAGGNDTVSYAGSSAAVTVNLVTGRGSNGDAAGDTYTRIQNVIGGDGNDTFIVGLDSVNFNGGGGTLNTVDYSGSSSAITANMLNNTVTRTFEPVNTLTNIQKVVGSSYSDTFIGGTGADIFDGGLAGSDTVDYSAGAAVTVDLYTGTGSGGNAAGDTLVHIQNVIGSTAGNNYFYASADANSFNGNKVNGNNTVSYSHATGAVIVDLTNSRDNTLAQNFATGDTFTNIQNVVGSVYDDLIVASNQTNHIDGGLGNNTISYEHSTDAVKINLATGLGSLGDAAGDTYANISNAIGGAGDDILVASGVANTLDGGGHGTYGNTVSYENSSAAVKINLATGLGSLGDAAGDVYLNIQNAIGGAGDDVIVASNVTNHIDGGGRGTNGNTVSYENSNLGVKVDLALGQGFFNDAAGDTYVNITNAVGGSGDDTFVGNNLTNSFEGGTGVNTISYEHSGDAVTINLATGQGSRGDAAGDFYYNIQNAIGGSGDDLIIASSANNTIDGGAGNNTVSYANSASAVKINLATGHGLLGDALGDTYLNINNAVGAASGGSIIVGNGANNTIDGGGGTNNTVSYESSGGAVTIDLGQKKGLAGDANNDIYINIQNATGGDGDDTIIASNVSNIIIGGLGNNTVSYANSTSGVKVNLASGQGFFGDAAGDTYQQIQNVIGSSSDDTFVGNNQTNIFWGGAGNNTVSYESSNTAVTIDLQLGVGTAGDAAGDIYHDITYAKGGSADDIIIASDAVNRIDGMGGSNNTVSYQHATTAVKINLATGLGLAGDAAGDIYTNIASAIAGSGNDNIIVGSSANNTINGGTGTNNTVSYESSSGAVTIDLGQKKGLAGDANNDTYVNIQNAYGGTGDDLIIASNVANIIDGLAGNNTVSYQNSQQGVRIDLWHGTGTNNDADGDKYYNITNAIGSLGDDVFVGTSVANTFTGNGGNDTISYEYSTGDLAINLNTQRGTAGDALGDIYVNISNAIGGAGNDTFVAGAGHNAFEGNGGSNTVSYANSTVGVTVNLGDANGLNGVGGGANGSFAVGDTYSHIENVIGSGAADDLTGYGVAGVKSVLFGGGGADALRGQVANANFTWASYVGSAAVTIDLNIGRGYGGDAEGDTLFNVNNILGSSNNDTFIANNATNIFDGGGGLDTVSYNASTAPVTVDLSGQTYATGLGGFAAGDTYLNIANAIGSSGNDILIGSATASRSILIGGGGSDNLYAYANATAIANTYASYSDTNNAVTVDFYANTAVDGSGMTDYLHNIVNAIGGGGNDLFIASSDINRIEGGGGSNNTVSYIHDTVGVTVDLSSGLGSGATGSLAANDTYLNIQSAIGGSGNDTFYGSNVTNYFDGMGGNNTVNYAHSNVGVAVDFTTMQGGDAINGCTSYANGDHYVNITNAVGSQYNDIFYSNTQANTFTGGGGSDTVSYAKSTGGDIIANLTSTYGTGGTDSNGDHYVGISNLVGSGVDNVHNNLTGNSGSNTLSVTGNLTINYLTGDGGSAITTSQTDTFNAQLGGNNTLIGGGGTNIFNVSAGNTNTIANALTGVSNLNTIDGHLGNSTLHFENLSSSLNLSTFSNHVSGITTLDVSTSTNTSLLVSASDVLNLTSGVGTNLTIKMTANESIQIDATNTNYTYLIFGNGDYAFYNASDVNHNTAIARIHIQLA